MQMTKRILTAVLQLRAVAVAPLIWIPLCLGASAQDLMQEPGRPVTAAAVIPQQVRYAGKIAARAGQTIAAEFRIYAAQEGGEPLWSETQQFPVAPDGSYSILLGSASQAGLPQSVFAGGAARWLGVSIERAPEQERVLLSSVPYAMKSADAESLSGHAASDFVTQEQLAAMTAPPVQTAQQTASPAFTPLTSGPISGTGTSGNLAVFTGANTIGNSVVVQVGNDIGINVTTPASLLDVGGAATVRGTLDLPTLGTATTTSGYNSNSLELGSSAWSTTTAGPVAQNFFFENLATGNNTASPAAKLDLLFASGSGNPAATGLSIGSNGLINFAAGQTFPGASTITTITTASPLTGGGSSGPLTLSLSLPTLEATLDAVYPQLATGNTFKANQSITGSLTTTVAVNTATLNSTTASISGLTTAIGGINVGNNVQMHQINVATPTTPYNSPFFQFIGSAYNSSSAAAVNQNFSWQTVVTGNNTASPSAYLQLLSGTGTTQSATGLKILPNGNITFAPGQTFPVTGTGGGTITGITTTSPLTGSGTTGSVALGLNTSALEATLNSVYAELGTSNTFAGEVVANQANGPTNSALVGLGTNGSIGTYGSSDTGYGVEGNSGSGAAVYGGSGGTAFGGYFLVNTTAATAVYAENDAAGNPHLPIAIKGVVTNAYAAGVLGKAVSDNSYGVYAEDVGGQDSYGLYASTTGLGSTAIYGSSTGGEDANNVTGAGVVGISSTGNGVVGSTLGTSANGAALGPNGPWGLWGDIGNTGSAEIGAGILGTADYYPAAFLRNNGPNPTLVANNSGAGPAAAFSGYTTYQQDPTLNVTNSSTGGAGEMVNYSNNAVTLYLSNNGTGGITDVAEFAKPKGAATGALFTTLMASTSKGVCGIGDGDMSCTGQIKSLVSTGGARTVETYAPQSAENWMEDYGTGTMERGVALVKIDPAFAETASETPDYHVFITPNADSKGLYVINKSLTSFEVRESGGGISSLTFDYKIVARRRGYETQRLTDVTERFNEAKTLADRANKPPAHPALPARRQTAPSHAPVMPASIKAALEAPERQLHPSHLAAPKPTQPKSLPTPSTHP